MVTGLVAVAVVASADVPRASAQPAHNRGASPQVRPTPTLASVTAELDRLARRAEQLAEQYNRAVISARSAGALATEARRQQGVADRRARLAQQSFVAMVTVQYEGGQSNSAGALLTSSNPQDYLDQLSTLDLVARQQASVVDGLQSARRAAGAAALRADSALSEARSRNRAISKGRADVVKQTAELRALRSRLTAAQQRA